VRKVAFGPGQGLSDRALYPGYQWTIPGYSEIYEVPQTVQILNFDRDRVLYPDSFGSIDIPTVDGTTVDVDAAVLFRFFSAPGTTDGVEHGGPSDLINKVGATNSQWRRYLSQVSENYLKRHLSSLSTVQFYDPKARQERVLETEQVMREALAPFGVQVKAVLLRRYTYREEIDQAIFKKNLQELEMSYNRVAGEFAEAQKEVNKVSATGDVTIKNLDKQGGSEVSKIRSEGDLYRRQRIAEADLLVAGARADVDRLRSEVLSKVGSEIYVALQLAQVLVSLKGGVVSNIDPFDFEGWVKRLTGPAGGLFGAPAGFPSGPVEEERIAPSDTLIMPPEISEPGMENTHGT
jgi:regulator of protease activity HflC (stomatin/prohibitin superfamily)